MGKVVTAAKTLTFPAWQGVVHGGRWGGREVGISEVEGSFENQSPGYLDL